MWHSRSRYSRTVLDYRYWRIFAQDLEEPVTEEKVLQPNQIVEEGILTRIGNGFWPLAVSFFTIFYIRGGKLKDGFRLL